MTHCHDWTRPSPTFAGSKTLQHTPRTGYMPEFDAKFDRAVGATWHDEFPWTFLTRLIEAGPRIGGSPGERRAADIVKEAFTDVGANPRYDSFPMRRWERGTAELAVHVERGDRAVERSFETVALPYSPPGDIRGELVDVGYGTPEEIDEHDVEGAVVVASTTTPPGRRFVHRMEKFGHAAAAGAEAFVFANHLEGQLPPTGTLRFGDEAAMPGVGVSAETGAWLTDYADIGGGAEARIRVDARTEDGISGNVIGELGPETAECVVLMAHYDAHDIAEGAMDNGCGITTVATAARLLARIEDTLDRRVVLAGVGCEETGLMGAKALAESLERTEVATVVNVDGAGRHRNLKMYSHGSDALRELARETVEKAGHPFVVEETPHPYSDHWPFLQEGVPAIQLHSEPEGDGDRGRGWGHTHADTRDKVDARNLRTHAALTAFLVREITKTDLPRVDRRDLREQLIEADAERGMRAAGVWPGGWD